MAETNRTLDPPAPDTEGWPEPETLEGRRNGPGAWAEYLAACAALGTLSRMPSGASAAVLEVVARTLRRVDRRHSDAARTFLRQAHGALEESELERRVLQAWRHFLRVTVEAWGLSRRVPRETAGEHYELVVNPAARELFDARRGAIAVTPHVGNWEAFLPGFVAQGWGPVYAIGKPPHNRPLSRRVQRTREHWGVRMLARKGAMRTALEVVGRGGVLGLLLDQRARKKPVMAPFFGRPAPCDRSAGVLLKRLAAPIVVGSCYCTEAPYRFRIEFPTVIMPEEVSGLSPAEIVERINTEMERMILARPDQYFWLHDRYRESGSRR